jgi:hypothetical protein
MKTKTQTRQVCIFSGIALATSGMVFGLCLPSSALTWNWSYTDDSGGGSTGGSGTFTTTDGPAPFTITGITGTAEGSIINSLLPPGSYAGNDNLLLSSQPSDVQLTFNGFGWSSFPDDRRFNIYFGFDNVASGRYELQYSSFDDELEMEISFSATPVSQPPAVVPEPSSLLSFITLGGLMLGGAVRGVRK